MRNRLRFLHLTLALVAGLFIVTLGVTGSIMAFEPDLDHLLHADLWHVEPGGEPLSLAAVATAINAPYPGQPISRYEVSTARDLAYRVERFGVSWHALPSAPSERRPHRRAACR